MNALILLLVFLYFIEHAVNENLNKLSGPYNVELKSVQPCEDTGTNEIYYKTRLSTLGNNEYCYSGEVYFPFGFDDNSSLVIDVSTRGNSGHWNLHFLSWTLKKACSDALRMFPNWFAIIQTQGYINYCPVAEGLHKFDCISLSVVQFANMQNLVYGTYRLNINHYMNNTKVGCIMYTADIVPK